MSLLRPASRFLAAHGGLADSIVIGDNFEFSDADIADDLHAPIVGTGIRILALSAEHGLAVASLPLHHRDPFDRLLIAQARREG